MDLFALGTPVIDLFARVDSKTIAKLGLKKGATNFFSAAKLSALERRLSGKITCRYPGDNARNVCEGFAALGGSCAFQGAVGSDKASEEFEANLAQCGIASLLQKKRGSTGKILALVTPDGQRTFCANLGAGTQCRLFERKALGSSRMFFASSITFCAPSPVAALAMKYMEEAEKGKKKIALSLESPPMVEKNRMRMLAVVEKFADILFLNEDEAFALLGKGAEKKLRTLKPDAMVFLKKGIRGSVLFEKGKSMRIPAMKAKAVDTTGAGDAYAAGALYGLSRGYSPHSSAKIGCMLATSVVKKMGAGIPLKHTRIMIKHWKS